MNNNLINRLVYDYKTNLYVPNPLNWIRRIGSKPDTIEDVASFTNKSVGKAAKGTINNIIGILKATGKLFINEITKAK